MKTFLLTACFLLAVSTHAAQPLIVAHRGASKDAPENTIPAFLLAWEQGADAIEGDFHLTEDGCIACIHDGNTKKVSDEKLVVSKSTLAELRSLDVGSYFGDSFEGARIPTFSEVVSTIPEGKKIFIEVKSGPEMIPVLLKAVEKSGLQTDQVVYISFKKEVIKKLKERVPDFEALWLCQFKKKAADSMKPSLEEVLNTLEDIQADGLSSNTSIPHEYIQSLIKEGYQWHVWTVNRPAEAVRMETMGAKSITTDLPESIRNRLYPD